MRPYLAYRGSWTWRVCDFFARNPDAQLTKPELLATFGPTRDVTASLARQRKAGLLVATGGRRARGVPDRT